MMNKIKLIIRKAKGLNLETLEAIKYSLFVLIALDLFGLFWYLDQKKLGSALLLVCMACLVIVMLLERRKFINMDYDKKKRKEKLEKELRELEKEEKSEKEDKKDEKPGLFGDLGLPSSEEYNKRVEESLGLYFIF